MSALAEFLQLARSRRSVRRFRPDAVPPAVLEALVEAARWAPSAGNLQDWEFAVVTSPVLVRRMAEAVDAGWRCLREKEGDTVFSSELGRYAGSFAWFAGAPVLVAVSVKRAEGFLVSLLEGRTAKVLGRQASAAMAAQNLMLAAHAAGLGSCCLTGPLLAEEELKGVLGLGRRRELVCLVALGWPAEKPGAPARKPVEEIARFVG